MLEVNEEVVRSDRPPCLGTVCGRSCWSSFLLQIETEDGQPWENTSETVRYLNNLYKIVSKPLTWHAALKECLTEGMRLVSITDPYQQAFLAVQAALRNTSFWIGLSSQDVRFFLFFLLAPLVD